MPSGLDLLRGEQSDRLITKQSGMDLLKQGQEQGQGQVTSGLDLLRSPQPELPAPVPKFEASTAPVSDLYEDPHIMNQMISAAPKPFYEKVGEMAFGEGITDSTLFQPPTMTDDDKRGAMEALNQLWGVAKNPYDAVRGTLTFAMSLPGFAQGALSAAVETSKEMGKRILKSEDFTLLDLYEAASKGMEKGAGRWHDSIVAPFDRLLQSPMTFGKYLSKKAVGEGEDPEPVDYSAVMGEIGMAPYTAASTPIHALAELDTFEYMPNVRGALHFTADVVGLIVMGKMYRGGQEKLAKDVEPIVRKAEEIDVKQKEIDRIPDEVVKAAQQKVLDVEKVQAELEARKLNENIDTESVVKGDLKEKGKKVKEIKKEKAVKKKVTTGQDLIKEKKIEAKKKAKKKTKKEKIEGEEISYNVISTKDPKEFKIQAKIGEKIVGSADVSIYDNVAYTEGLHTLKEYQRKGIMTGIHNYILSSGLADKIDTFPDVFTEEGSMFFNKYREITDKSMLQGKTDYSKLDIERLKHILEEGEIDTQLGSPKSESLSTNNSPFRDTPEETKAIRRAFKDRMQNVKEDPDLMTGKLINDVNRWLDGEEVPIEKVRNGLSELAARANEVRNKFDKVEDFEAWKEVTSDAADWARNADRSELKDIFPNKLIRAEYEMAERLNKYITDVENKIGTTAEENRLLDIGETVEGGSIDKGISRVIQSRFKKGSIPEELSEDFIEFGDKVRDLETGELRPILGGENPRTYHIEILKEKIGDKLASLEKLKADRLIDKRTEPIKLNMMVPVNELPMRVKEVLKGIKATVGDIYRNKEVFDKTGFWYGRDGKWRYEIDDSNMHVNMNELYQNKGKEYKIQSIVQHPKLFTQVPELKNTKIKYSRYAYTSYYSPTSDIIVLNKPVRSNLIHEIQHAVNDKVNAFRGSSPSGESSIIATKIYQGLKKSVKDSGMLEDIEDIFRDNRLIEDIQRDLTALSNSAKKYSKRPTELTDAKAIDKVLESIGAESSRERYMKVPGEMEARLSSERMSMTAEQRKVEAPWETLDRMLFEEGYGRIKEVMDYSSYETPGTKLYDITGAVSEGAKQLIAGAKRLSAYTAKARGMKAFKPRQAAQMLREEFNRSFIDRSGNIRGKLLDELGDQGYDVIQKMYLSKGASSLSANMLKQMRKEVYDGLSSNEKRILDNLILADRMIAIGKYKTPKQFKFPEGLSPKDSAAYNELFQYTEKLSPRRAEVLKRKAAAYFEWMKKPLKDMLNAELITEQEFNDLSSHKYRRLKIVDVYDKQYQSKIGKKKRTVYDSGVESLARGRDTDVFEPSSEIMALEVFNRAYGRILNNKANQSLLEVAKADNTNPFVRVKEGPKDKIPTGWNRIFVYDKGERKAIYLSPEMSKEWITNNPEISYKMGQVLRYASASPVLRTFATGIEWGFALANIPRDVMHLWYTARVYENGKWRPVYSPTAPIFALQIGRDLSTVFIDAALRKGRYNKYMEEGGGMEFLVHQGRLLQRGRHVEGGLDTANDFLGYFGETSEVMTRLAIRERVIRRRANEQGITVEEASKDPKIVQEATFAARDYMDFGQGGGIAKASDNSIPYLNAAIQGTRGLFRSFKPGSGSALSSTYKLTQFGLITAGITIASYKFAPQTFKALQGNIDMQNNICLPLGDNFGFEDEHGQMRYPYLKWPLDPGQRFFKTFFEESTRKWLGYEVDTNKVVDSLKDLSPVSTSMLPPTVSGVLGYMANKDFWLNEDIWRKSDKPFSWPESREEYIPGRTPQAFIDIGEKTGLSPERLQFAVEELFTSGSMWGTLVGQGYEAAFGDLPKNKKEQHLAMTLSKIPVIKRFFGVTNPYSQYGQAIDEAKESSDIQRWIQNRGLDMRVEGYLYQDNVSRKEVIDYMREFKDKKVYDRLKDRFTFQEKIKGLPNRTFWLRLKGLTTEARAKVYVDRLNSASDEERKELYEELGTVIKAGGVMSPGFREEVGKLRR